MVVSSNCLLLIPTINYITLDRKIIMLLGWIILLFSPKGQMEGTSDPFGVVVGTYIDGLEMLHFKC